MRSDAMCWGFHWRTGLICDWHNQLQHGDFKAPEHMGQIINVEGDNATK